MENKKWVLGGISFESSVKDGTLALRVKSLFLLLVPLANEIGKSYGIHIIPDELNLFVDSLFIVLAGVFHIWGWLRAKV